MRARQSRPPGLVRAKPLPVAGRLRCLRATRARWMCVTWAAILLESTSIGGDSTRLVHDTFVDTRRLPLCRPTVVGVQKFFFDGVVVIAHRGVNRRVDLPAIGLAVQFHCPAVSVDHGGELRAALYVVAPDAQVSSPGLIPPHITFTLDVPADPFGVKLLNDRE